MNQRSQRIININNSNNNDNKQHNIANNKQITAINKGAWLLTKRKKFNTDIHEHKKNRPIKRLIS